MWKAKKMHKYLNINWQHYNVFLNLLQILPTKIIFLFEFMKDRTNIIYYTERDVMWVINASSSIFEKYKWALSFYKENHVS